MADGVAITAGSGTTVATDDAGASGHVQLFKLAYSADGVATLVTADGNGLEVQLGVALPAGTNNIGDVDVLTLPNVTLDAGTLAALETIGLDAATLSALETITIGTALPAGTNAIGKLAANSGVDIGDVDVTSLPAENRPATGTLANVSASASSVTLQASNASRRGLVVVNDSTSICYVKFGSTASATSFTYKLQSEDHLELPAPVYTGIVTGIWVSATGTARVTELT